MSFFAKYKRINLITCLIITYIGCTTNVSAINRSLLTANFKPPSTITYYTLQENIKDINQEVEPKYFIRTNVISFIAIYSILLLSLFVFLYFRAKQKHNDEISFQRLNLNQQKNEFNSQRDEWEIQRNLVMFQRDKIITMLTDLGESIDYARKIQQAILPSDNYLNNILSDYFLIFQPRESVGGDFYWATKYDNLTCFAVADCTGHGVPGGFMSMLGTTMLNDVLIRSVDLKPSSMLDQLRGKMIKSLNQTGKDEDSQDGMDISLCVYNQDTRELSYSGANLSIFIFSSNIPEPSDRIIIHENIFEVKADRMPISYYQRMNNFTETTIKLNENDIIYLYSDGYVDQFGGANNKKFGYTPFRKLIQSVTNESIENQKARIWSVFDQWKGAENQTDDVLILGIKI